MKSRRYKKAESFLQKSKVYSFKEALKALKEINNENLGQIKVSFFLNKKGKNQLSFRDFFKIPHIVKPTKIAIINSDFSSSFKSKFENISFLEVDQIKETISSQRNKKKWGFDKLFAESSVIASIKPLARKLSSKKCFPNSKDGTIFKSEKDVLEYLEGKTEVKSDKDGNFNFLLGKTSFEDFRIEENYEAVLNKVKSLKPVNWKGEYLKSITLSTAMSPGIKVSLR